MCVYKDCRGGSSWQTLRVRDIATAIDLADVIVHTRDSNVTWLPDDSGFLYVTVPWTGDVGAPAHFPCIKHHKMHTAADKDTVVGRYTGSHQATWHPYVTFTEPKHGAGVYSFLYVRAGCSKGWSLYVSPGFVLPFTRDLSFASEAVTAAADPHPLPLPVVEPRLVLGGFDFVLDESFVQGPILYSMTNVHAPRNRLVAVNLDNDSEMEPGDVTCRRLWELLPEAADPQRIMQAVHFVRFGGNVFAFVKWCVGAVTTTVALYKLVGAHGGSPFDPGHLQLVLDALPIPATCVTVDVMATHDEPAVIVTVSGLFLPACKFLVDLRDVSVAELPVLVHPGMLPPSAFQTRVVHTDSGVPVIVFGKRLEDNPLAHPTRPRRTLVKGYGGFRIDMAHPQFDPTRVLHMQGLWDDADGVAADPPLFAIACIRGGKEFGMAWAEQGRRRQKHRCFDDFKAASDLLVDAGLTTRAQLALQGRSNGGLLVLACITKWPDMAAAVVADVPLADMLRFHTAGGGPNWVVEYGDPEDPADADYLRSYSPVHNVPAMGVRLPPVLCITSTTDQNVPPWHAYKMVATLNAAGAAGTAGTAQTARLLLTDSTGHGFAPGVAAQSHTDAWVLWTLNSILKA
jgi:prolyl oligopeptidase